MYPQFAPSPHFHISLYTVKSACLKSESWGAVMFKFQMEFIKHFSISRAMLSTDEIQQDDVRVGLNKQEPSS